MTIAEDRTRLKIPYAPSAIISGVIGRKDSEKGRTYERPSDGLILDSVTHVLDVTGDQSFVKNWYAKLAGQLMMKRFEDLASLTASDAPAKAIEAFTKTKKRSPTSVEAVAIARAEWIKVELKKLSEIKAGIGNHQHTILEALVLDAPIPDVPAHLVDVEVDDDRIDHDEISDGLLQFFTDFPDAAVIMAEATVATPEMGIAGTLDLIMYFPRGITIKGVTYYYLLIDLKAGKWLKADMRAQLAAYRHSSEVWLDYLGNTAPMPVVDGAAVLHLRRDYDAGYKLIIVDAGPEQFEWFCDRIRQFKKAKAQPKRLGDVAYPPLPDGSQPLPLIEDLDTPGFGYCRSPLRRAGLRRLDDLAAFTETDIRAIQGIGAQRFESCRIALAQYNLSFAQGEN